MERFPTRCLEAQKTGNERLSRMETRLAHVEHELHSGFHELSSKMDQTRQETVDLLRQLVTNTRK
ncbi:MAG: hypothetical protein HQM11_03875 [SAR324 cluster bacterium]|nr:hypothetical protein [SAR324 cluster bacterium]